MRSRSYQAFHISVLILASCLISAGPALAVSISWVDWTSANSTNATGNASGVTVDFNGVINPVAQTSGGTNYWTTPSTYTSSPAVDNAPPSSDIIRLTGGTAAGIQTLTFSAPVVNPVMAINSMGQPGVAVRYDFDTAFTILNNGPGFWGNGPLTALPGDVLEGREGHGIIQFTGTISSISWTIPTAEFWHGFTIGIPGSTGPNPVPEPSTLLLSALGLLGLASRRMKRRTPDDVQ